jgi:hypothetical protein
LLLIFTSCQKAAHTDAVTDPDAAENTDSVAVIDTTIDANALLATNRQCPNAPNYGDSIIYPQPQSNDYTVEPINNVGIKGTYLSWPEGLSINKNTGVINLSKSETGARYVIAFIKKGTTDTCVSQVILGGITYADSIYVISKNDTLAAPVFNANPSATPVCDVSDDSDYPDNNNNGNNKCSFDDDIPGQKANDQKLKVRTKSGIINLKRSVIEGIFGSNPKNGDSKKIKIVYSLNDNSKKAKQKLSVQVIYYDKVSNIPAALKTEVIAKRKNLMEYHVVNGRPRPPLLIIAGLAK